VKGFYDGDNELNDRSWCKKLTTSLSISQCKFTEKVFIDITKDVTFETIHLSAIECLEESDEYMVILFDILTHLMERLR
jgi:hypothetical protein